MAKDNASGAGMEPTVIPMNGNYELRRQAGRFQHWNLFLNGEQLRPITRFEGDFIDAALEAGRTDATRLLAESQAHNAKLEAQVERLRVLVLTCATRLEFADTMLTAAAGEPTPDNFKYSRDCAEAAKRCGTTAEEARAALNP